MAYVFVAAAPRSGTTFLGELMALHHDICAWHEPYFIWDYKIKHLQSNYLDEQDATQEVIAFVRKEFRIYLSKSKKKILIEKTPANALKISFMNKIFPEAKWIHLYRDGRAVVSSLKEKYAYRQSMVSNRNVMQFLQDVHYTLKRQPFWRHKLMQIWYELKYRRHLSPYLASLGDHKHNVVTFGPRYPGWIDDVKNLTPIEFMAKQWVECEKFISRDLNQIEKNNVLNLSYEDLVLNPELAIKNICEHIGVSSQPLLARLNKVDVNKINKWHKNLSHDELNKISPIIHNTMIGLGYTI